MAVIDAEQVDSPKPIPSFGCAADGDADRPRFGLESDRGGGDFCRAAASAAALLG